MKAARTTARIIADVNPEIKEKLIALSKETNKSMTEILSMLIDTCYKELNK